MQRVLRALTLDASPAATAAAARAPATDRRTRLAGGETVFGVVATASANVRADESFLRVAPDPTTIGETSIATGPRWVVIDPARASPAGN